MAVIKVQMDSVSALAAEMASLSTDVQECVLLARQARNGLDWQVAAKAGVDTRLNGLCTQLQNRQSQMDVLRGQMQNAASAFQKVSGTLTLGARGVQFGLGKLASEVASAEAGLSNQKGLKKSALVSKTIASGGIAITAGLLSFTKNKDGFNGYLAGATAVSKDKIGNMDVVTTSSVQVGAVRGKVSKDNDMFGYEKASGNKTGMSMDTGDANSGSDGVTEYDGSLSSKEKYKALCKGVSAETGFSVLEINHETVMGDENYGATVGADVKLLEAKAAGSAGFKLDGQDGLQVKVKGEVGLSAASVEGHGVVRVAGVESKVSVQAEVGFSLYGEMNYTKDEGLTIGVGGAFFVGGKVKFTIKPPKWFRIF